MSKWLESEWAVMDVCAYICVCVWSACKWYHHNPFIWHAITTWSCKGTPKIRELQKLCFTCFFFFVLNGMKCCYWRISLCFFFYFVEMYQLKCLRLMNNKKNILLKLILCGTQWESKDKKKTECAQELSSSYEGDFQLCANWGK